MFKYDFYMLYDTYKKRFLDILKRICERKVVPLQQIKKGNSFLSHLIQEKHTITRGTESVQLIISDNIRNYYTEYFWWISTED